MVRCSNSDIGACRRAVCRPLHRLELLRQLTEMRHVNVLESTRVSELFGEDKSSLALFDSLGGILLRSDDYAALFALRHRILCDLSFWSFWDLVVMQSGWCLLDVKMFNDQYNNGLYSYICLVRDLPSTSNFRNCLTTPSRSCALLASISLDSLCVYDNVYDGLYDLCWILLQKSTSVGLFGSSKRCSLQYTDHQLRCFKYQLHLVKRMVDVRSPVADILSFYMDINALIKCLSSSVSSDFDVCNTSYVAALLDMEVMSVVHSSQHFHRMKKLLAVVDSIIW